MINVLRAPGSYVFASNPVVFELETDRPFELNVKISAQGKDIQLSVTPYLSSVLFKASFDISTVLKSLFADIYIPEYNVMNPIDGFSFPFTVFIDDAQIYQGTAFEGGISKRLLSDLSKLGMDVFSYRLNNTLRNFFFTNRTNSHHLFVRDTELFPFVCIYPQTAISFITRNGRVFTIPSFAGLSVVSVNIQVIRKIFADMYGELPSFLVVQVNGTYSFDITIVNGEVSAEKHILLFRNSLGGYEKIEVTGRAFNAPEFSEPNMYQSLNDLHFFEDYRERLNTRQVIKVQAGYKSKEELLFIKDLIASEEVYIYEPATRHRCLVSPPSDMQIPEVFTEPSTVELVLRDITEDGSASAEIDTNLPVDNPFDNITTEDDTRLNGLGFIYGDQVSLHG